MKQLETTHNFQAHLMRIAYINIQKPCNKL